MALHDLYSWKDANLHKNFTKSDYARHLIQWMEICQFRSSERKVSRAATFGDISKLVMNSDLIICKYISGALITTSYRSPATLLCSFQHYQSRSRIWEISASMAHPVTVCIKSNFIAESYLTVHEFPSLIALERLSPCSQNPTLDLNSLAIFTPITPWLNFNSLQFKNQVSHWSLPWGVISQKLWKKNDSFTHACCMSHSSCPSCFIHGTNIRWSVAMMKLFVMSFSPVLKWK